MVHRIGSPLCTLARRILRRLITARVNAGTMDNIFPSVYRGYAIFSNYISRSSRAQKKNKDKVTPRRSFVKNCATSLIKLTLCSLIMLITPRYSPYAIKNRAIRENSYVYVGHNDVVEVTLFLVREEQIRHPDAISFRQG